ncbi:MAG: hypothetical protein LRY76_01680 [Alphaproteobacteria bacterium]|nr:hypothetical protein [Alphaproteobacteria bacterium]
MDIKDMPEMGGMKWENPAGVDGRHLTTDIIPLSEYVSMRRRIGGRNAFAPKTNFDVHWLEDLKAQNEIMNSLSNDYVFSSATMEPEALLFLLEAIRMFQPQRILELGTGLSTLILSHAQSQILSKDNGKKPAFVTIDQSEDHSASVMERAKNAGVAKFIAPLVFPLCRYRIGDEFDLDEKAMGCYDFDEKKLHKAMGGVKPDMIIIDGPADEKVMSNASFAKVLALPILSTLTAPGALIFMHNAYADPEIFAMEQWRDSGAANILGVKAVGKGMMVALGRS